VPDPLLNSKSALAYAFLSKRRFKNAKALADTRDTTPELEQIMGMNRTLGGLAVIATAVAVPMLVFLRTRPRDYTQTREFRRLVGDYVI
jgi:hypothetical protein